MNESVDVAALATMSPKEAMKMLEKIRGDISRNQEQDLQTLIREVAIEANKRIEELKESYAKKNIDFIINGTITIDIENGKIGVAYTDNKPLATKVSKNAIHHYRDRQDELKGRSMYFNLRGITFDVSLNPQNIWATIYDDKVITADSPSTLIKRVAKEIFNIKSNQSGWLVIKVKMEDNENDDNSEESIIEDIGNELPQDFANEII